MAGSSLFAPLLPLRRSRPLAASLLGGDATRSSASLDSLARPSSLDEPLRLITGHGFETALRGRIVGLLPPNAPSTVLFEVWYELGVVGAFAGAVALLRPSRSAGRDHPLLVPGIMAAFATAFAFACLGIGTAQVWWFTALAVVVLIFVATERGQFRTTRPKAILRRRRARTDRLTTGCHAAAGTSMRRSCTAWQATPSSERRDLAPAALVGERAARVEGAARAAD